MKYLVISDIHGSCTGAEVFEDACRLHNPDAVLCLGDVLYHGPRNPVPENHDPKAVARIMTQYSERIFAVLPQAACASSVTGDLLQCACKVKYQRSKIYF